MGRALLDRRAQRRAWCKRCSWPTNSSSVVGLTRAANGAPGDRTVSVAASAGSNSESISHSMVSAMISTGECLAIPLTDGSSLEAELFLPQAGGRGGGAEVQAGPLSDAAGRAGGDEGRAGPYPGVLVLHESFGLNDDMRRIASRFAEEGYAVLLPNLFSHGSRIVCLSRVMTDMVRGSIDREIADILAARAALAEREDVDADRIAVAGFCLGGGFALIAATKPGFKAAAVNYGDVPKDRAKLDGVCPVVASFGSKDRMFGRTWPSAWRRIWALSEWSTTFRPMTGRVTPSSPSMKAGRAGLHGCPHR